MRSQFDVENDMIGRGRAGTGEAGFDPRIYHDEARRLRAEAIADAVRGARTGVAGVLQHLTGACRRLLLAVADGVGAVRRYERLARMSDAELARLGITRADVPWFAVSGERPAQPEGASCGPDSQASGDGDARHVDDGASRQARRSATGRKPVPTQRAA